MMKKIITTIILTLCIYLTYSQNNNDAIFKNIVKEYTLNMDGSIDFREIKEIELLSHYSFHRLYGETFIIYNTEYQDLKINSAYTIMRNGKKVITPNNAFNQVLPRFCSHSPAYNHIREMVVTHTGLEVGATINLDYTIHSKPFFYPGIMENELLLNTSPTNNLSIVVNIPVNQELYFNLINAEEKPLIEIKNGIKTYTWNFKNLPANSKDQFQVSNHMSEPQLQFSNLKFKKAIEYFVNNESTKAVTNKSMDETVKEVKSKYSDKLMVTLELQKLVSKNLENIYFPLKYSGYKFRNTVDTWNSNQGTPLEKAMVLKALLQKADIISEVVAITPDKLYGEVGDLSSFNEFALKVSISNREEIFISSNKENSQSLLYGLEGMAILPLSWKNKPTPFFPKERLSEIEITADIKHLHANKPQGMAKIEIENEQNPYFSIITDSSYVKRLIGGVGEIISYEVSTLTPDESISKLSFNPSIKSEGFYHQLSLPYSSFGIESWHMTELPSERNVPLELPELLSEKYEFVIEIPGDAMLVTNETSTIIDNEIGSLKIQIQKKDNTISVVRSLTFKKRIIPVDHYQKFKSIMDLWNTVNFKKIVYKRTAK